MLGKFILGWLFGVVLSAKVLAGVQAVLVDTLDPEAGKITISTQEGLLKFERLGSPEESSLLIYDQNQQEILIVEHQTKGYTRIDNAFVAQVAKQMAVLKKQLDAIPPEQREMMQQMLGDNMPGIAQAQGEPKATYRKTGRKQKAGDYSCLVTEKRLKDVKLMEFCVADLGKLPGSAPLLSIVKNMAAMFEPLAQSIPTAYSGNPFEDISSLDGFPVIITEYQNGQGTSRMQLESMAKQTFKDDFFAVPKGYRQQASPGLGF